MPDGPALGVLIEAFGKMDEMYAWPSLDGEGFYAPGTREVAEVAVAALRAAGLLSDGTADV